MTQGSIIWREANAFLETLYVETYGDYVPATLEINGTVHHPKSVADVVRLHVEDTPVLGGWIAVYRMFISNLPNFSSYATIVSPIIRATIANAIIGTDCRLSAIVARLGRGETLQMAVRELAEPIRISTARKDGVVWQRSIKGFAQGLEWLTGLEALYPTPAAWVGEQIGEQTRGAVQGERMWAFAETIFNRRGKAKLTLMGEAITVNFLKDMGLLPFVKPDTFTMRIIGALHGETNEKGTFLEMIRCANDADIWPRAFDRALWLIGSGKFHYLPDDIYRNAAGKGEARIAAFAARVGSSGPTPDDNPPPPTVQP
ncbi:MULTISPECIES: hypothetical protein [Sphingobium]|jgi:hypothetical protein|uniref:hypothetical protein n=1 Tax=Sphingobium TaxID=165695 RepID=UPI000DBB0A31|nr:MULTISPECIES: hypothetical protein [Sphingobium]KAA9011371.1 hypothetical protein F4U94_20900 [Sphingobium limneticum]MBU0932622.1 hypothetical protein [Alphaproteobacteria bacterium]BBD02251.1 hypothetical protein YGS_C2P0264 [Sphingobium sp. YG1]